MPLGARGMFGEIMDFLGPMPALCELFSFESVIVEALVE